MASNFDFTENGSSPSPPRGRSKGCLVAAIVASIFVIAVFLLLFALLRDFSPAPREISAAKVSFSGRVIAVDPVREGPGADTYRLRHHIEIDFDAPAPGWDAATERARANQLKGTVDPAPLPNAGSERHTMTVEVEVAKLLDGLAPGDLVEGEAKVSKIAHQQGTTTEVVITSLNKTK